jgi:hypothetical protein
LDPVVNAIEIYDPKLATMLAGTYAVKLGQINSLRLFLTGIGAEFVIEFKGARNLERIRFSSPGLALQRVNLNELYESAPVKINPGTAHPLWEVIRSTIVTRDLSGRDFTAIAELREELMRHQTDLLQARAAIRSFMTISFTITDFLFIG